MDNNELPVGVDAIAAAAAVAVALLEDDEDEIFQLMMNIANIAALEWMEMDGDGEMNLDQLKNWQKVTVHLDEYHTFGAYSFRLHFRMSRRVFESLVQTVGNHLVEMGRLRRERRPLQDILLMVLWIMATPDTFRSVALRFGVNPGTLYYFYGYIIQALRELSDHYINWPTEPERNVIKEVFRRVSGFPGIVGCIDGTHVYVTKPVRNAARYKNRHHTYSLNVQAVVDNNLLVRDLRIGEAGCMNDKRVFRRSALCRDLLQGANDRLDANIEHIVGDGGYTLTDFLLIPFSNNGHLTPAQINYNRCLSQCRVRVENGFGLAKGKWRRLKMLHVRKEDIAVDHIAASFMLHNFTIVNGEQLLTEDELRRPLHANEILGNEGNEDEIEEEDDEDAVDGNDFEELIVAAKARGQEKRIFIMDHLGAFH